MAGKGSHKGERRGGRQKGTPNKFTQSAKQAFQDAFEKLGGVGALSEWAKANPTDFYKLFSKLIPVDVTTGGNPLTQIEIIIKKPQ